MAQLTKEAFDQAPGKLATKEDLKGFATKDDPAEVRDGLKSLATKGDLTVLRDDLTAHIDASVIGVKDEIAGLRTAMNVKFDAIIELLDVRKDVANTGSPA